MSGINQQLVLDLLSQAPNGLPEDELKSHFTGKNFKKIVSPMLERREIVIDGSNIYSVNRQNQRSDNHPTRRSRKHVFVSTNGLNQRDAFLFIKYCAKKYREHALINGVPAVGVNDYYRYFHRSDVVLLKKHLYSNDSHFIFKQLIFHAQNGTKISDVIDFLNKERVIAATTHNFDPIAFLTDYRSNPIGLKNQFITSMYPHTPLNSIPSSVGIFFECMCECALFIKRENITSSADLRSFLLRGNINPRNSRLLLDNFRAAGIAHCYGNGETLPFDFIKEFGKAYRYIDFDYPKPDLHVNRTMFCLFDNEASNLLADGVSFGQFEKKVKIDRHESIRCFFLITDLLKARLGNPSVSNYFLDKVIYIVCSGDWYLDGRMTPHYPTEKNIFLQNVVTGNYKTEANVGFTDAEFIDFINHAI